MNQFCYYLKVMEIKNNILEPNLETMALHGVHLGALRAHSNPKMKSYVWSNKNVFQIIDLEKSKEDLEKALSFLVGVKEKGGTILFVGTGFAAKELTQKIAEDLNMPYVTERWLCGTFTNFETIQKRVEYFKSLETKKAAGEFEKYTKKERMKLDKEIELLKVKFDGIRNMSKLPDAVLILDLKKDETSVREAKRKGIKIIGIVDTNIDPAIADYPVPANDDAISSVKYILEKVKEVILDSKQEK